MYSLTDLALLCIAISATAYQFAGIILLHLGFLLYLESVHKDRYRLPFPNYLWVLFIAAGIALYWHIAALGYIIFSVLYTLKKKRSLGPFSPFFRGFQSYFLVAGVVGFSHVFALLAGTLLFVRNFFGDLRDVTKDKSEKSRTLPIVFGIKSDRKYLHLVATLLTTSTWWYISGISIVWLALVVVIEVGTYYLTPR